VSETVMANLHRNNAAEWVMVAVLYPIAIVLRMSSVIATFVSSRLRD
jgi:hypothetical protein